MRIANDDVAKFLTRIVPFVETEGARNLYKMSLELSIPYQTLRFRMLRLSEQGITIIPVLNVEELGLQRVRVSFELSTDLKDPKVLFGGLHQTAGLTYYSRSLLTQIFDCEFNIPRDSRKELSRLLLALEEMKIIEKVTLRNLLWKEVLMMKTQYYDYRENQWDIDFTEFSGDPSLKIPSMSHKEDFDHIDLLIIKSLQIDPWIKVVDLAKEIKMTEGDISYHINKHVFGRNQIGGFRFRWVGTRDAWAKHTILPLTLEFKGLSDEDSRHAMSVVTSTPFTWNHMRAEDGTYFSELLVPVSHLPETMRYISDNLRALKLFPRIALGDMSCVSSFTVPYMMHQKSHGWVFNAEMSLSYCLQMIKTYGT